VDHQHSTEHDWTLSVVQWTHDGRELNTSHVTLIIDEFDETTHGGVYQCSATLAGVGRAVSDVATLHAAGTCKPRQEHLLYN